LVATLSRLGDDDAVITEEEAKEINRMVQELTEQGAAAVPAIGDLLRRRRDVDFDKLAGGGLIDYGSLRLALLDVLSQIGGDDALEVALEQLRATKDPVEIAMLALSLEQEDPWAYREEILKAAREALLRAGRVPPEERADVSPLFELFQAYGGLEVVAALEQGMPTWWRYSLMALAALPDGEGVPSLVDEASAAGVPVERRAGLPFQMLAQASIQSPEAAEALVNLARSGQIPDRAWNPVGSALKGMHFELPLRLFDGTPADGNGAPASGAEAPLLGTHNGADMSYELRLASANWSEEQINRQLALIDELLDITESPAAVKALGEARGSLLGKLPK
jgi:hypothetical protein